MRLSVRWGGIRDIWRKLQSKCPASTKARVNLVGRLFNQIVRVGVGSVRSARTERRVRSIMQDTVSVNEQGMCRCCLGVGTIASSPGGQQQLCPECLGGTIDLINYPPHYIRLTPEPIEVYRILGIGVSLRLLCQVRCAGGV